MASSKLDFRPHHFHLAYYVAGSTASMIRGHLDGYQTSDFWSEDEFLICVASPQKKSLLHCVIGTAISSEILGDPCALVGNEDGKRFIRELYHAYGPSLSAPEPLEESDEVLEILEKDFARFEEPLAEDVFGLLFVDRVTLWQFQVYVSERIKQLNASQYPTILEADGIVRRSPVPSWLSRAIHHRDQNRCAICRTDLSGSVAVPEESEHLDHMVPLERSGSNDTTNFQLTCGPCNRKKRSKNVQPSPFRIPFF